MHHGSFLLERGKKHCFGFQLHEFGQLIHGAEFNDTALTVFDASRLFSRFDTILAKIAHVRGNRYVVIAPSILIDLHGTGYCDLDPEFAHG